MKCMNSKVLGSRNATVRATKLTERLSDGKSHSNLRVVHPPLIVGNMYSAEAYAPLSGMFDIPILQTTAKTIQEQTTSNKATNEQHASKQGNPEVAESYVNMNE